MIPALALVFLVPAGQEAEPVFRLSTDRPVCHESGSKRVCAFPSPSHLPERHVRVQADCNGPVELNGTKLLRDETGWDVGGVLRTGRSNELVLAAGCPAPVILTTPRVYAVFAKRSQDGSKVLILLDNTLENTTNFACEVYDQRGQRIGEVVGTLGAGEKRLVEVSPKGRPAELRLWKAPEAVEGGYRFVVPVV